MDGKRKPKIQGRAAKGKDRMGGRRERESGYLPAGSTDSVKLRSVSSSVISARGLDCITPSSVRRDSQVVWHPIVHSNTHFIELTVEGTRPSSLVSHTVYGTSLASQYPMPSFCTSSPAPDLPLAGGGGGHALAAA